jgi:hypothetical protein
MSKNPKRPRLQKTVASDIAPKHQFTHSSHTSTRTRQIMTTGASLNQSEPTQTTSSSFNMDSESFIPPLFDDFPGMITELDPPAGVELRTKARRYGNSVSMIDTL